MNSPRSPCPTTLRWRSPELPYRPAHHHPALLIELARSRRMADHRLLRHTGLFMDEVLRGEARLSDCQYRRLMRNVDSQKAGTELALLWGRQFFPGHYGPLSSLIHNSRHLQQALECIQRYRHLACPLVSPRWVMDNNWCYLVWIDGAGTGPTRHFACTAMMAAIYGLFRHRTGQSAQWYFYFAQSASHSPALYHVSLGERVLFGAGINLMIFPREDLFRHWNDSSDTLFKVAKHQLHGLGNGIVASGLPELIYRFLLQHLDRPVSLERTAKACGISPASLKRHLQVCGTSFRLLLDEARLHYSLYLSQVKGLSTEQIAERLSRGDTTNFRRSFKRWTGMTPAQYLQQLTPST